MIELKNVTKEYIGKSNNVVALKDISFVLPNNGLVFITGKSGCGKSTLLNTIGALDKISSGDIIIDNKSISKFKEKELDEYRNKYIGFIFQDFNLLLDYNVETNIKMSLDLQKKKCNSEDIEEILRKVDLEDYGDRKINELSGGEQQRVAIARALIKNPEIILCDEPSGSLDSETSKQIFELLKKLSATCLVIVVSHDKESAEQYGDRIIELKDGQIINDIQKNVINSLNKADFNIEKYSFTNKRIFNLGLNFLKHKPLRMIISLLLSIISVSFFAFSCTVSNINMVSAVSDSMTKNNEKYLSIAKSLVATEHYPNGATVQWNDHINMNDADINFIKSQTGVDNYNIVYRNFNATINNFKNLDPGQYTCNSSNGFIEITNDIFDKYNFTFYGNVPQNDDEVVIPHYFYDMFEKYGYINNAIESSITKYDDLIGKTIELHDYANDGKKIFKITGIVQTNFNCDRYNKILDNKSDQQKLTSELNKVLEAGLHNILYLKEGYYSRNIKKDYTDYFTPENNAWNFDVAYGDDAFIKNYKIITKIKNCKNDIYLNPFKDSQKGMLLGLSDIMPDVKPYMSKYVDKFSKENYEKIKDAIIKDHPTWTTREFYAQYIKDNGYIDASYLHLDYDYFRSNTINEYLEKYNIFRNYGHPIFIIDKLQRTKNFPVCLIGLYDDTKNGETIKDTFFVSDELHDDVIKDFGYILYDYSYVVTPYSKNMDKNKAVISLTDKQVIEKNLNVPWPKSVYDYSSYSLKNQYVSAFQEANKMFFSFNYIFIGVASAALVFSSIFIYFYISGVIYKKEKEIGILRAMGTSKSDIIKIFTCENLLFGFIVATFSSIIFSIGVYAANLLFINKTMSVLTILNFNYLGILLIILVTFSSIFIGILIPILKVINKKPIDIIKEI
ncbi:MAG: ABC transporter ATP-binding protein/permease [Bacilli bacterium]